MLEKLLGTMSVQQFLEEYYFKLPLAMADGCKSLASHGTLEALGTMLAHPKADVIVAERGGPWKGKTPTNAAQACALLEAGCTVGVRHAHEIDESIARLARGFHDDFLSPVDIHIYATPPGFAGFSWHYDAEEVFILQTRGAKDWFLRKNTVNPWPLVETLPADMQYQREIMPLFHCSLSAGDWLYIPAGYWHRTEARQESTDVSVSLSIGIKAHTGVDVFDFLRGRILESLCWRQRLTVIGAASLQNDAQLVESLRLQFSELGRDLAGLLARPEAARAFLAAHGRPAQG